MDKMTILGLRWYNLSLIWVELSCISPLLGILAILLFNNKQ